MAVKQLSVFVENSPGKLREIINVISGAGVNIRATSIADAKDYGILRLIVSDTEKVKESLASECLLSTNDVIAASMSDKAGSLSDILNILGDKGIDIDYLYAFTSHIQDKAYVVIRVADNETAEKALNEKGIDTLSDEDIQNL